MLFRSAKEAGMSSKVLTEKLLAHGYDIKGPSSTVEDDIAEKIRTTVLKISKAEAAKKKVVPEEAPAVLRRTTVIRRRPTAVPEADVVAEVAVEAVESLPVVQEAAPAEVSVPAPTSDHVPESEVVMENPPETVSESVQPLAVTEVVDGAADTGAREAVAPVVVDFTEHNKELHKDSKPFSAKSFPIKHDKKRIAPDDRDPAARKGLARVVGSIEMPVPEKSTVDERPRKKPERPSERPAGAGGYKPQATTPKPAVEIGRAHV